VGPNGLVKRCFRQGGEPYLHLYPHSRSGGPGIDVSRARNTPHAAADAPTASPPARNSRNPAEKSAPGPDLQAATCAADRCNREGMSGEITGNSQRLHKARSPTEDECLPPNWGDTPPPNTIENIYIFSVHAMKPIGRKFRLGSSLSERSATSMACGPAPCVRRR
jgi:hypothetical protein